ncbi:PREDICTED: uncharacterized protein LOC106748107 [Dinoponera quadriceps]|uniref:Uncharacterized protein LOC106748107 n=1 Tax=Dinoponera quadriceps TaxID=609295 RepID=A0A6P3XUU6_DINQU|nr:PREDICTED: uncharacterized protein LOC106748107 [Dinoponera quadriceps]
MPCRQTYEMNKREINKAAQRDQSYRNCLIALLIFFFLCIILILACLPWKTRSRQGYGNDEHGDPKSQHGERVKESEDIMSAATTVVDDVIKSSNVSWREDVEGPDTHEDFKDGKAQDETTTPSRGIFMAEYEDYFTEDSSETNTRQPEEDEAVTASEDIMVASRQETPTSMSSTFSIGLVENVTANSTDGYVTSTVEGATGRVTSSMLSSRRAEEATTVQYFSDEYLSSEEPELGMATDNVAISTSSTQSVGLVEDVNANSTAGHLTSEDKDVIGNVTSSTLPTRFADEATTVKYSSDEYLNSENPEFNMTTDIVTTSTSPTRPSDLTEDASANSTDEYVTSRVKGAIGSVTSSTTGFTEEATTVQYSSSEYYSSGKPELSAATDNVITSASSSIQPAGLAEDAVANSTGEYMTSEANVATDNVASSTSPTRLNYLEGSSTANSIDTHEISRTVVTAINPSTNLEENTNTENSSDSYHYPQESQSIATVIYRRTTTPTTTQFKEDEFTETSTEGYLNRKNESTTTYDGALINSDDATRGSSPVTEDNTLFLSKDFPTTTATTGITNVAEDITNVTASARSQNEAVEIMYNESTTPVATEKSSTYNYTNVSAFSTSTMPRIRITSFLSHNNTTTTALPLPDEERDVCYTEHCKRTASKMLSYMNHLADPCDDFYEYACGGFEANPQVIDGDLVRQTKNYQRIARQMASEKREIAHSAFATYYDSCVQYERTVNFNERVKMAIDALKDVGKFYINATWSDNYTDFTNLFLQLILHHSALLFDIVPKFDEFHPAHFTLQISLPKYESPFMTEHADDLCSEDELETEEHYVDLEALYGNYKKCKKNEEEFLRSIKEALTVFRVFKDFNDSYLTLDLQSQYIEKTVHDVDSIIMRGYFSYFPSKDKIQEVYARNIYDKISLKGLHSSLVNWTQLVHSLLGADMIEANSINDNDLHIYLYGGLMKGLHELKQFAKQDPMSLNNAIMALYAHKLYRELVLSRRNDVKSHCLQVATNLLRLEASSLYISSFSNYEIRKMNELIETSFNDLKRTLKQKTEEAEWTKESGREGLLAKVDSLTLSLPALSYYRDRDSLYSDYNMSQTILYSNYFNNSMILLKRYRTLMYAVLRQVDGEKRIWSHYATPFQPKARVIYDSNLVVIPYGITDWSSMNEVHTLSYILLATLGNLIAHQIAHHFDANGLFSWTLSKSMIYEDEMNEMNSDDYINCHKDNLYQAPMNFTLPYTEQTVSLTIPQLTLNERLSDIVGLRLAYDTLALTRSNAEKRLPWIKLRIEQLFYLAYAQMYCTKSPLTSSYVSLYESEDLPSRIRVFVSASNNKFVADEWSCPMGSQIAPNDVCSVFPYIDSKESMRAPV